ncbi:hypothetical protein KKD49_07990 [Myxococcota bacterium]|nr:hypothetical protein [Myxococcota bacterium]
MFSIIKDRSIRNPQKIRIKASPLKGVRFLKDVETGHEHKKNRAVPKIIKISLFSLFFFCMFVSLLYLSDKQKENLKQKKEISRIKQEVGVPDLRS